MKLYLEDFVNRKQQLEKFWKMIRGEEKERIMLIYGTSGMGKSYFLKECQKQLQENCIEYAKLDVKLGMDSDYMTIVHRILQKFGPEGDKELMKILHQNANESKGPNDSFRIFISSTWHDLKPERDAVEAALQRMKDIPVSMKYFGSQSDSPKDFSLKEVKRSDYYIGIFGFHYGSGITEDEYRQAQKKDIPCLIYFKDESIRAKTVELDPAKAANLQALKNELKKNHTVSFFKSTGELTTQIATDLHNKIIERYKEHLKNFTQKEHPLVKERTQQKITSAFRTSLAELTKARKMVFIIDSWEKATDDIREWLQNNLLEWIYDNTLNQAVAIVAGTTDVIFQEMHRSIQAMKLAGLPQEAVRIYLEEKYDLPPEKVPTIIEFSGGHPLALSIIADEHLKKTANAL